MKKINIAFICDAHEIGGQEMVCLNMLRNIDRNRFNPLVYSFRGGTLLKEIKDLGLQAIIGSNKNPLSYKNGWTEEDANEKKTYLGILTKEMQKDSVDIALIFAWGDGVIAARKANIPVMIEKVDGELLIGKVKDKSFFDKIVCESEKIKGLILEQRGRLGCGKGQIEVIYNGIDLKIFDRKKYDSVKEKKKLGLSGKEFVIGYVGRIIAVKNIQLLIKSARSLISDYKVNNFKVVIVGPDHGDLNNIKKLTCKLGLNNKIIFTGMRRDVPNILSTFDAFVMTSVVEGTPTAMIEAMAMGLPIVSIASGSIPEVIKDNGFLIDVFQPKIFAKKLFILMNDAKLRKKMCKQSIGLSKKYNIKKTMGSYEKIFINCLERKLVTY